MTHYSIEKILERDPHEFYNETFEKSYPRKRYSSAVGSVAVKKN